MNTDNLIIEIRNQIVQGVIEANKAGAKCGVPDCFKLTRETPIGVLEYQVPILLTEEEQSSLANMKRTGRCRFGRSPCSDSAREN